MSGLSFFLLGSGKSMGDALIPVLHRALCDIERANQAILGANGEAQTAPEDSVAGCAETLPGVRAP